MQSPIAPIPQKPFFKRPAAVSPAQFRRLYLPLLAATAIGLTASNYYVSSTSSYAHQSEEEERLRKNQLIMDAYGDKDNLHDIERALAAYEF